MNKEFTIEDLDLLLWDWTVITLPIVRDEHKIAILATAHRILNPNFFSTDPESSIGSELGEYGYTVSRTTLTHLRDGWLRITNEFTANYEN